MEGDITEVGVHIIMTPPPRPVGSHQKQAMWGNVASQNHWSDVIMDHCAHVLLELDQCINFLHTPHAPIF